MTGNYVGDGVAAALDAVYVVIAQNRNSDLSL